MTHKMTGSRSDTWALIPDILKYDQLSYRKTQVSSPSIKVNSTYHWALMRMKRGSKYTDCAQCLKDHRHPNIFVHPFSSKVWNCECKCGLWNLFLFYFIFKLYSIVLVLPNIEMNPPQVYLRSPSWTLLPPPSMHGTVLQHFNSFCCSVYFSLSVMSISLWPHGLQHARPPCPSLTPRVYSNSCTLSQWCHPTISSSVIPFSSCPQSFPASGSFQMSQLSESGGQSIGVSASTSVPPMSTQDWFPLGWTGWISLQSKRLSRIFSNTTVQKHQFFGAQLSL